MPGTPYRRSNPVVITFPLDNGMAINQFIPQAPQGTLVTMIYIVQLPASANVTMSYGQQLGKRVFQGQCFTFGGGEDCPGAMDLGLSFDVAATSGEILQIELATLGSLGNVVAGQ